jgi:hypothetical protein
MKKNILIFIIFLSGFGCASMENYAQPDQPVIPKSNVITWEERPRPIASGSGGQIWVRASEIINLLFGGQDEKGNSNIFLANSKNVGDTFRHPIVVNSKSGKIKLHGENGPQLRMGNGVEIFAAWVENRDIQFARSVNYGRSFLPSIRVNDDKNKASQSFHIMEVSPEGTVFVSWLDGRDKKNNKPGTSSIYIARSTDRGKTFGKNIKIAGDICPCCRPAIAFGKNGHIFVSWRHLYPGNLRKVVVASSRDNGSTWSKPISVSKQGWKINGCAHSGPAMKYVDEKLFLIWYTGQGGKASLNMAWSPDEGRSFNVLRDIQKEVLDPNHPHIETINGDPWVIFQGRDPYKKGGWAPSEAWVTKLSNNGKASIPQRIPTDGKGVIYPYLSKGYGGRIYATWTTLTDNGPKVMLSRGRTGVSKLY